MSLKRTSIKTNESKVIDNNRLSEELKNILDDFFCKQKENIEIVADNSIDMNHRGYEISFENAPNNRMDKQMLQKLINHPNFKSISIKAIRFKHDGDLKKAE